MNHEIRLPVASSSCLVFHHDYINIKILITVIKLILAPCTIISSASYKNYNYFTNVLSRGVGGDVGGVGGGHHNEGVDEDNE